MSMATGSKNNFDAGSWEEALHDVFVGATVGAAHNFYFLKKGVYVNVVRPLAVAFGYHFEHEKIVESNDKEKKLKVIGVGFGRTGTYSLTLALEELGFPTLHTQHLYEHEQIMGMWTSEIFLPSIRRKKAMLGKPDLDLIASYGYQATADLPMALYVDQIMEAYPDCKFILTTRENSEVWFRSWDTLIKSISQPTHFGGIFILGVRRYTYYLRWLLSVVNKDDSYLTRRFPLPDQNKEAAIASYEEHNKRVRELVPADKLLEYSVKEGWQPLCNFLEIADCPDTPFPKTNSARSVQVQAMSALITPLISILFIIFYLFSAGFKKATGRTVVGWVNWRRLQLLEMLRMALKDDRAFATTRACCKKNP